MTTSLLWFRQDLRLEDNPALTAALADGAAVVPLFIWPAEDRSAWAMGSASRWWLQRSLRALEAALAARGSRLIIRVGEPREVLDELIDATGANRICWNRCYEPAAVARDSELKSALRSRGIPVESRNAALLFEPRTIQTGAGTPYRVFTPFAKACRQATPPSLPVAAPDRVRAPEAWPSSASLDDLAPRSTAGWEAGLASVWTPGAAAANAALDRFCDGPVGDYLEAREIPGTVGTSRWSPHLHFGELSVRAAWHALGERIEAHPDPRLRRAAEGVQRQLLWREFAGHLLYHFPTTTDQPLREEFARFPWVEDGSALRAWQQGRTGYPIVDAGMRELWQTGWMHNRVRMLVGSFLVKDLRLPWQEGARWFWDTLVDADLANNTLGWQWVAGCGADAAPFFRIFNPVTQGERFDPAGRYVRHWLPALRQLPDRWVHRPWEAPASVLAAARLVLGTDYPRPIVDHALAREEALAAFRSLKA